MASITFNSFIHPNTICWTVIILTPVVNIVHVCLYGVKNVQDKHIKLNIDIKPSLQIGTFFEIIINLEKHINFGTCHLCNHPVHYFNSCISICEKVPMWTAYMQEVLIVLIEANIEVLLYLILLSHPINLFGIVYWVEVYIIKTVCDIYSSVCVE